MLDALQDVGMLLDQGLAPAYSQWRQGSIEVFPHRPAEFRLAAVGLDDAHVRAYADKGAIQQVGTAPAGQGLLAKTDLPFGDSLGGCEGRRSVVSGKSV